MLGVLTSVQLDDDSGVEGSKVANIEPDLVLAAEFEARKLATPQSAPKKPFGIGQVVSKGTDVSAHGQSRA